MQEFFWIHVIKDLNRRNDQDPPQIEEYPRVSYTMDTIR